MTLHSSALRAAMLQRPFVSSTRNGASRGDDAADARRKSHREL